MKMQLILSDIMIHIWILYSYNYEHIYNYGLILSFFYYFFKFEKKDLFINLYILIMIYTYFHLFFSADREFVLTIFFYNTFGNTVFNIIKYCIKNEEACFIFSLIFCNYFLFSNSLLFLYFIGLCSQLYFSNILKINYRLNTYLLPLFLFIIIEKFENIYFGYTYTYIQM
jgi:hypothetical protein